VAGTGWKKLYVYLGREKLVEYSAGVTWFFHADHLGTPKVRTTHLGAVAESWDTYPFGEQWIAGLPGDQHRYTGHLRDAESNNDYAGARYYSNVRGRWLSVDPVRGDVQEPQSLNRYNYTLNDPINRVDRDGRDPVIIGYDEICMEVIIDNRTEQKRRYCYRAFFPIGFWHYRNGNDPIIGPPKGPSGAIGEVAERAARDRLTQADCLKTMGGEKAFEVLRDMMANGKIEFVDSLEEGTNAQTVLKFGSTRTGMFTGRKLVDATIQISRSGEWFSDRSELDKFNKAYGTNLTSAERQESILLHELGHVMTAMGLATFLDDNPAQFRDSRIGRAYNRANDQRILQDCF